MLYYEVLNRYHNPSMMFLLFQLLRIICSITILNTYLTLQVLQSICRQGCSVISHIGKWYFACPLPKYNYNRRRRKHLITNNFHHVWSLFSLISWCYNLWPLQNFIAIIIIIIIFSGNLLPWTMRTDLARWVGIWLLCQSFCARDVVLVPSKCAWPRVEHE